MSAVPIKSGRPGRTTKTLTWSFALMLALAIGMLPARMAFADQMLELPQSMATAAPAPENFVKPATPPRAMAPMPSDLGSIQDYENQGESTRPSSNNAIASSNVRFDPGHNRAALANDAILGVMVIGLYAMELHAAHHHSRR